jgi:hypothetical protein
MSLFKLNYDLNFNTRGKNDLHLLQPRLSIYSKGIYYMGIKTFNHLHSCIKNYLIIRIKLKVYKNYLLLKSFYSLKDFFNNEG